MPVDPFETQSLDLPVPQGVSETNAREPDELEHTLYESDNDRMHPKARSRAKHFGVRPRFSEVYTDKLPCERRLRDSVSFDFLSTVFKLAF